MFWWCFVLCLIVRSFMHFIRNINFVLIFTVFCWCWLSSLLPFLCCFFDCFGLIFDTKITKKRQKMIKKWGQFWTPLLEASWELLGLSWEGLGPLLGALGPPKWVPRGWHSLRLGCLLSHLASFLFFFVFGAPPGAFLGGFRPHLGAIWAHLGTIFRDFELTFWDA